VHFGYDARGNQITRDGKTEVTYNSFNKPTAITKNGSDISLKYGADLARYQQTRKEGTDTITTHYIGKHFEVEHRNGEKTWRSFISDIAILNQYSNKDPDIQFTHRDRLGSAVTMTDRNNHVSVRRFFDPFGKPRVGGDWSHWSSLGMPASLFNEPGSEKGSRKGFVS
jgi:uncharacterized protein RhaS with RHS repeats